MFIYSMYKPIFLPRFSILVRVGSFVFSQTFFEQFRMTVMLENFTPSTRLTVFVDTMVKWSQTHAYIIFFAITDNHLLSYPRQSLRQHQWVSNTRYRDSPHFQGLALIFTQVGKRIQFKHCPSVTLSMNTFIKEMFSTYVLSRK